MPGWSSQYEPVAGFIRQNNLRDSPIPTIEAAATRLLFAEIAITHLEVDYVKVEHTPTFFGVDICIGATLP